MLLEAKNPLISVGDEVTWCRGQKELVELAELLGLPVAGEMANLGYWSKPFPTRHPLFVGPHVAQHALSGKARRAAQPRQPLRRARGARHQADLDPHRSGEPRAQRTGRSRHGRRSAARHRRSDRGDPQHGDRAAAQGDRRGAQRADPRLHRADGDAPEGSRGARTSPPISLERLGLELEAALDRDTCYVATSTPARPWTR